MKIRPEQFKGSDTERIQKAVNKAKASDTVLIAGDKQSVWRIDSAIIVNSDKRIEIHDCTIKLSDKCRDNFIRSGNCGFGISEHAPLKNIQILGFGKAVLEGADAPRATGDSGKPLRSFIPEDPVGVWTPASFGTDADKPDEYPKGDWRNIGVLLVNVEHFTISGLTLREYHCWGISLENCSYGTVNDITFDAHDPIPINGQLQITRNKDGLDLRYGCHHIDIYDIKGGSGDDIIALTTLTQGENKFEHSTEVGWQKDVKSLDIHDVTIRNIRAKTPHQLIRLLCSYPNRVYNIEISDIIAQENTRRACILGDVGYNGAKGEISDVTIRDFKSSAYQSCIELISTCRNIHIENVTNLCKEIPLLKINSSADVSNISCRNNA